MSARATVRKRESQHRGGLAGLQKRRADASRDGLLVKVGLPVGSAPYGDGTSVIDVAFANEFGTEDGRVPERPFLRAAMTRYKRAHQAAALKLARAVDSGEKPVRVALNLLGTIAASNVQEQIRDTTQPPNAPSTIRRKGSSHPLIDIGHMIQSITWKVFRGRK